MTTYAMLLNPSHNRIYFESAKSLAGAELTALLGICGISPDNFRTQRIAGIDYLLFDCAEKLGSVGLEALARCSAFFCLFIYHSQEHLQPVEAQSIRIFDDGLNTILKYQGKTNELFTRLMVNLAASACDKPIDRPHILLDPLCGKGTTLFEGAIRGYNVIGIDTNADMIQEIKTYFSAYLKRLRVHHDYSRESRSVDNRKVLEITHCDYALEKADLKSGRGLRMTTASGDSLNSRLFIKNNLCDMLVADLPYGIQHASKTVAPTKNKVTAITRDAATLVERALPSWRKAMRKGAAVVLSFNELTTKKADLAAIFEANGIAVLEGEQYNGYFHRVDQAINRDLIVGRVL